MMRPLLVVFLVTATAVPSGVLGKPGTTAEGAGTVQSLVGVAGTVLTTSGTASALAPRETAGPDTFALYGGPDQPAEGKFQLADRTTADWGSGNGLPGGYGGGPGAWTPIDDSKQRVHWHPDPFNAENLNGNGAGNHAMWCGLPPGDPDTAGWANPQGYGNDWSDALIYVSAPIDDESVGQVVSLDFFFNHDTEAGYDFVHVEFLRGGSWIEVGSATGTNTGFPAPGIRFSDIQTAPIEYFGNDYGYEGLVSGGVVIRIRFESDGGWSDEDGKFISTAGAAQVDDISLTTSQGTFFEDYEGAGPYLFRPWQPPFFGDFADVYTQFTDLDPCRSNRTPVVGFIDYNQIVRNGPGATGAVQTGGEPNQGEVYGIPGNWATNHSGGLDGIGTIQNSIVSPEIWLDAPGLGDDDPAFAGYRLRFDAFEHGGIAGFGDGQIWYEWDVRCALPGEGFGDWTGDNWSYGYGTTGRWVARDLDISPWIVPGAERLQVRLSVLDACQFIFGCDPNSAPAPVFDNVAVYKHRLPGPLLTVRAEHQAQDGFPVSGAIDAGTSVGRDGLDVPFDMALDVNDQDTVNSPGDSVVVEAIARIPGTTITDLRMVWALRTNALFEDALRSVPSRPKDQNVVAGAAGTIWTGEVLADSVRAPGGGVLADRFFADLPDVDFLYPGDVLHYYYRATDSDGRVSTLPFDLSGFGDFASTSSFDRRFTVRALPSVADAAGAQPSLLVIDESGESGDGPEIHASLRELGFAEGIDYDTYLVRSPVAMAGNGIGSSGAHGATAAQLAGYGNIVYLAGSHASGLLSDGSSPHDHGDDIGVLEAWHALAGPRNAAWFGDSLAWYLAEHHPAFLAGTLGAAALGPDLRDAIGGQTDPIVLVDPAWSTYFANSWAVLGGCPANFDFDQIQPLAGSSAGHWFSDPAGIPITDPAAGVASVIRAGANGLHVTFPFSLAVIADVQARATGRSARTALLGELLDFFGAGGGSPAVSAPRAGAVQLSVSPNPFNPMTVVRFSGVAGRSGSVRVYNLRGELVRELHRGEFTGEQFAWDGRDDAGSGVASAVYVVRAEVDGEVRVAKVALVR